MSCNEVKARSFGFLKRLQGLLSLKQLTTVQSLYSPPTEPACVDEHEYNLSDVIYDAKVFGTYHMFERLKFLVLNNEFFIKAYKWLEPEKCQPRLDARRCFFWYS